MSKDKVFYYVLCGACCAFMALALVVGLKAGAPDVIDHSTGFADHDDLTANRCTRPCADSTASFPPATTVARLTEALNDQWGSIFSSRRVCTSSFQTWFTFRIGAPPFPPDAMADGMTFTIQNDPRGANALGSGGGGLGYGRDFDGDIAPLPPPDTISNSAAIKIDFWNNHSETDNSTGLFTNGRTPTIPKAGWNVCNSAGCSPLVLPDTLVALDKRPVSMGGSGIDLRSTHVFQVDLRYETTKNGPALTESITDNTDPDNPFISFTYPIDLSAYVGAEGAYVGFTGATGGVNARMDILTWRYECPAPPR